MWRSWKMKSVLLLLILSVILLDCFSTVLSNEGLLIQKDIGYSIDIVNHASDKQCTRSILNSYAKGRVSFPYFYADCFAEIEQEGIYPQALYLSVSDLPSKDVLDRFNWGIVEKVDSKTSWHLDSLNWRGMDALQTVSLSFEVDPSDKIMNVSTVSLMPHSVTTLDISSYRNEHNHLLTALIQQFGKHLNTLFLDGDSFPIDSSVFGSAFRGNPFVEKIYLFNPFNSINHECHNIFDDIVKLLSFEDKPFVRLWNVACRDYTPRQIAQVLDLLRPLSTGVLSISAKKFMSADEYVDNLFRIGDLARERNVSVGVNFMSSVQIQLYFKTIIEPNGIRYIEVDNEWLLKLKEFAPKHQYNSYFGRVFDALYKGYYGEIRGITRFEYEDYLSIVGGHGFPSLIYADQEENVFTEFSLSSTINDQRSCSQTSLGAYSRGEVDMKIFSASCFAEIRKLGYRPATLRILNVHLTSSEVSRELDWRIVNIVDGLMVENLNILPWGRMRKLEELRLDFKLKGKIPMKQWSMDMFPRSLKKLSCNEGIGYENLYNNTMQYFGRRVADIYLRGQVFPSIDPSNLALSFLRNKKLSKITLAIENEVECGLSLETAKRVLSQDKSRVVSVGVCCSRYAVEDLLDIFDHLKASRKSSFTVDIPYHSAFRYMERLLVTGDFARERNLAGRLQVALFKGGSVTWSKSPIVKPARPNNIAVEREWFNNLLKNPRFYHLRDTFPLVFEDLWHGYYGQRRGIDQTQYDRYLELIAGFPKQVM